MGVPFWHCTFPDLSVPWRLLSMKHSWLALAALLGVTAVTARAEYFRFHGRSIT